LTFAKIARRGVPFGFEKFQVGEGKVKLWHYSRVAAATFIDMVNIVLSSRVSGGKT
jgi:hypothetical protein